MLAVAGAISGHGHGRFHIASNYLLRPGGIRARVTYVVIAHRFVLYPVSSC